MYVLRVYQLVCDVRNFLSKSPLRVGVPYHFCTVMLSDHTSLTENIVPTFLILEQFLNFGVTKTLHPRKCLPKFILFRNCNRNEYNVPYPNACRYIVFNTIYECVKKTFFDVGPFNFFKKKHCKKDTRVFYRYLSIC